MEDSVDVGVGVDHLLYALPLAGVSFGKTEKKKTQNLSLVENLSDVIVHNFTEAFIGVGGTYFST